MGLRELIAQVLFYSGISHLFFFLSRLWYGRQHIRVINYHSTPKLYLGNLERQLKFYQKYYSNTTLEELNEFINTRIWKKDKPGLIISLDDGLKNNIDSALPLLETYGFTGWLCIPTGYIKENHDKGLDPDELISMYGIDTTAKESMAMSTEELKQVAHRHEIVCHTYTHMRLPISVNNIEVLKKELVQSRDELEHICNKKVLGFCWVGGELDNYSALAHTLIKQNYHFGFQTNNYPITKNTDRYFINRNNIEAWFSTALFLLTLSGLYDLMYWSKRKKLRKQLV